jgi:hypothetical protein
VPAGKGSSPLLPGGIGHHACRHHDRHARCIAVTGAGAGGIPPPSIGAALREAWSEAESLGCVSPLDKNRGGTPEGVRALQGARRAKARRLRNSVLRRSASFSFVFVARMERSKIRELHSSFLIVPRILLCSIRATALPQLDRDGAGNHHRLGLTKIETRS